jgi:hypothetical protein
MNDKCKIFVPKAVDGKCECIEIFDNNDTGCNHTVCEKIVLQDGKQCNPATGACIIEPINCDLELEKIIPRAEDRDCYEAVCTEGGCTAQLRLDIDIDHDAIDQCGNCIIGGRDPPVECLFADDDYTLYFAGVGTAVIAIVVTAVVIALLIGFIGGRKVYDLVTAARAADISATSTNPLYQEDARGGDNPLHG